VSEALLWAFGAAAVLWITGFTAGQGFAFVRRIRDVV